MLLRGVKLTLSVKVVDETLPDEDRVADGLFDNENVLDLEPSSNVSV